MADANTSAVDLSKMAAIYEAYREQPGPLIPILQQAQAVYGYLPPEAIRWIAKRLDISMGQVYGVATFYSQFYLGARGRHVLKICDGTACHVKGSQALVTAVENERHVSPGETTKDGSLTVEKVYCLGSCALAPVVVLDEEVVGRMTPDGLLDALDDQLGPESEQGDRHDG